MIKFFSLFVLRSISGAFIFKKIEYSKTEETIQKKIENVKLIMYVLLDLYGIVYYSISYRLHVYLHSSYRHHKLDHNFSLGKSII